MKKKNLKSSIVFARWCVVVFAILAGFYFYRGKMFASLISVFVAGLVVCVKYELNYRLEEMESDEEMHSTLAARKLLKSSHP